MQKNLQHEANRSCNNLPNHDTRTSLHNQIGEEHQQGCTIYTPPLRKTPFIAAFSRLSAGVVAAIYRSSLSQSHTNLRGSSPQFTDFWKWIRVSPSYPLEEVNTYLHRSAGCLLEITMHSSFKHSPAHVLDLYLQGIFSHIARWRSLSLFLDDDQQHRIIEHLCTVPAPYLDELHLSLLTGDATLCFFTGNLNTSIYSYPFPFKTITYLRLNTALSYDQVCDVLLTTPRLVKLILCLLYYPSEHQTNRIVTLPSLLTLELFFHNFEDTSGLRKLLAMPSLRRLVLAGPSASGLTTWLDELEDQRGLYPTLRSFKFGIVGVSTDVLKRLICSLPDLTNVTMRIYGEKKGKESIIDASALMPICDETAWPHLDTLTLQFEESSKEALEFIPVICSIIACRTSIHHIRLHFFIDHYHISSGESRSIAWLRARVDLEYLNVCSTCDAAWDRTNDTWVHICD
jgi:hypothetical protein